MMAHSSGMDRGRLIMVQSWNTAAHHDILLVTIKHQKKTNVEPKEQQSSHAF